MPIGWIDFSKSERSKVLSVLDLLSEDGTLDELGIAPIRDGFAELFFPGTSTIQTRAKYFFIVPYALRDLETSKVTDPNTALRIFDEVERDCARRLMQNDDSTGVIGRVALNQNSWVKRTPADIYWAGLRAYGIFRAGISIRDYVRVICSSKLGKHNLAKLGNRNDGADDGDTDDKDAGRYGMYQFWLMPTYSEEWKKDLSIHLTEEEGQFLKNQMILSYPNSMLAHILKNDLKDITTICNSFQDLEKWIQLFPEDIRRNFYLASEFSDFIIVIRTIYNLIISDSKNEEANYEWNRSLPNLMSIANVDLEKIYGVLKIRNTRLMRFLTTIQEQMKSADLDSMKIEIRRREKELKQSRAKTMHPGELNPNQWYGGKGLVYRFQNAKVLMKDIFDSEVQHAEP